MYEAVKSSESDARLNLKYLNIETTIYFIAQMHFYLLSEFYFDFIHNLKLNAHISEFKVILDLIK